MNYRPSLQTSADRASAVRRVHSGSSSLRLVGNRAGPSFAGNAEFQRQTDNKQQEHRKGQIDSAVPPVVSPQNQEQQGPNEQCRAAGGDQFGASSPRGRAFDVVPCNDSGEEQHRHILEMSVRRRSHGDRYEEREHKSTRSRALANSEANKREQEKNNFSCPEVGPRTICLPDSCQKAAPIRHQTWIQPSIPGVTIESAHEPDVFNEAAGPHDQRAYENQQYSAPDESRHQPEFAPEQQQGYEYQQILELDRCQRQHQSRCHLQILAHQ